MPYMGKKNSITEECSIENVFFPLTLIFAENLLQLNDVKSSIESITSACSQLTVNTQFGANEIPHILITFIFTILFAALLYPLYKQYDWSIYKRISPTDLDLQSN
ncbi:224_t:CDS:2 [Diversispora eburnea]|uniref:224_t:CDS:1 n=1 Tax=Diversispora eburnea TaxID=1213867 RepID=A0A9N9BQP6_9GLOM|nr:224_t:CDS:2 [Diversispora eburnea]